MPSQATPADAPALERRLATILSADVAGYSKMMGADEEATVQTLRGHRAVFEALLKQHPARRRCLTSKFRVQSGGDNGVEARGRWANGAPVEGRWTRSQ